MISHASVIRAALFKYSPIALRRSRPFSTIAPLAVMAGADVPVPVQDKPVFFTPCLTALAAGYNP